MYTYIIIDDEELTRKGTIKKLEPMNDLVCCIGEAENGEEGLRLIKTSNPDIIITDMQMPVMHGSLFLPEVSRLYPEKSIIVISGFRDFEYAKNAIQANAVDYILKPFGKKEIQEAMNHAISKLELSSLGDSSNIDDATKEVTYYEYDIQTLSNLILGYDTKTNTFYSKRLNFINNTHDLIMITIHSTANLDHKQFENFLFENGFGDLALYLQHIQSKTIGFIVLFISEHTSINPTEYCRQIARCLISAYGTNTPELSLGISSIHHNLQELHLAFSETISALNNCKISEHTNIIKTYTIPSDELHSYNWIDSERFLFRLESGDTDEVLVLLKELFNQFRSTDLLSIGEIKYFLINLTDETKKIMSTYLEQIHAPSVSASMHTALNTMFSLTEVEPYFTQLFSNITEVMKNETNIFTSDDTIQKMKLYVEKNYYKDLNIEFISSLFYMNRSYLSHLFKKETGTNFVDYVNQVRLQKACQLLVQTDKKMYQVSKIVGYDNIKYFFRVFKKHIGITPEQYRLKNGTSEMK